MKLLNTIVLFLFIAGFGFAQDPAPVKRPPTPSDTTLASPTSQIAAWYRYAVYLEQLVALRDAEILRLGGGAPVDPLATRVTALEGQVAELKTAVAALKTALDARPPTVPVITSPGLNEYKAGTNVTLTATADGNPAPTWQWRKNGVPVPGWTNAALTLPSITTNDTAVYTAVATNSAGSAQASVTIIVVP